MGDSERRTPQEVHDVEGDQLQDVRDGEEVPWYVRLEAPAFSLPAKCTYTPTHRGERLRERQGEGKLLSQCQVMGEGGIRTT